MRLYPLFHLFTYSFYIGLETIGLCQGRADPAPGGEMRIRVVEGERIARADGEEALALIDVPLLLGQLEGLTVEELLQKFSAGAGKTMANDRILLSGLQ
jgi:hypothetical protein